MQQNLCKGDAHHLVHIVLLQDGVVVADGLYEEVLPPAMEPAPLQATIFQHIIIVLVKQSMRRYLPAGCGAHSSSSSHRRWLPASPLGRTGSQI